MPAPFQFDGAEFVHNAADRRPAHEHVDSCDLDRLALDLPPIQGLRHGLLRLRAPSAGGRGGSRRGPLLHELFTHAPFIFRIVYRLFLHILKRNGDLCAELHFYVGCDPFVALHALQDRAAGKYGADFEHAAVVCRRALAVAAEHWNLRLHFLHQFAQVGTDLIRPAAGCNAHFLQAVGLLNRLLQLLPDRLVRIGFKQQRNLHPALGPVVEHLYDKRIFKQLVQRAVARVFCKFFKKMTLKAIVHILLLAHKCR